MNKLRISSTTNLFHDSTDNISEFIRKSLSFYKEMGFDAADFSMKILPLDDDGWQPIVEKARQDAEKIGTMFEVCHLPFDAQICRHPERLSAFCARVHRAIDAANLLGVDYAVMHPNTISLPLSEFNRKEQHDSVLEHLSPFVEHAVKVGLNIVVENMGVVYGKEPVYRYCGEPDELCEIADGLDIGVCWDFGHAHINGLKQSEALAYVGKRLKVLHVNDNFSNGDIHLAPFMGTIDWKDAMKGLSDIGFKGLFNYEVATQNQPVAVQEAFAGYLVDAAKELISYMD